MLGRETPWRQGSVIAQADAIAAGLFDETSSSLKRALVITHDCDLTNDRELEVEVMIGDVVDKLNKQFARARNVRRLHLAFDTPSGNQQFIDLQITAKQSISKSLIAGSKPDGGWVLSDEEKRSLKQWLAARYGRPAFPNAFETHLRKNVSKKETVEDRLGKVLEKVSAHLVGVFFDLGENRAAELTDGSPYDLRIAVVYDASEGGQPARLAAEEVVSEIREIFQSAYGPPEAATEIALESCEAVADLRFPLSDLRKVDQWRAEYISLRQDPPESFLAVGELPA
jgi:hypothetical protein